MVPKPKGLSHAEAASMVLVGLTSLQAIEKYRGGVEGKTVLITSGRKLPLWTSKAVLDEWR